MTEDKDYTRLYLYKNDPQGCCKYWFGEASVDGCVSSIIQSTYINTTQAANMTAVNNTEKYLEMWYPVLEEYKCLKDGKMPPWMLEEGYTKWYLFHTRSSCCGAFGCG